MKLSFLTITKLLLLTAAILLTAQVQAEETSSLSQFGDMPEFNPEVTMSLTAGTDNDENQLMLMNPAYQQERIEDLRFLNLDGMLPATAPAGKWTWMRTNEGVKPYKFMDDMTFVGIPLFVAGIIAKSEKKAFRQNDGTRHVLLTKFKTRIDDYTQYFGPAVTLGLKIGGVEGRSDWGRLLASSAMSYGIMAILVNSIKYTAKEMRPDGTSANSWPSGHTATSFVGATILHKEYGLTRSPWYSVAGYGVATATGVMRVLNNRHWVSDVLSGAGIGILSGELAYALGDLLFKGKGLLRNDLNTGSNIVTNPSFFSVSMGMGFGSKNLTFDMDKFSAISDDEDPNLDLKLGVSTAVSAEGAYFFNKYFGVGGRLRVNSSPVKGWDGIERRAENDLLETYLDLATSEETAAIMNSSGTPGEPGYQPGLMDDYNLSIKSDHLTEFAVDLGVYFNLPLSKRFALGSKLLVGRSIMQAIDLDATVTGGIKDFDYIADDEGYIEKISNVKNLGNYTSSWDYFTVEGNNTFKVGTGISLTYAYKSNFAWKIFLDYDYTRKTYTMTYNPGGFLIDGMPNVVKELNLKSSDIEEYQSIRKARNTFVLGGSFAINF